VLEALAYCLGHPVELPPLVRQRCRAAASCCAKARRVFQIERELTPSGVEAVVSDSSGTGTCAMSARSRSGFCQSSHRLRSMLGERGQSSPYMSVVGPCFLVDQDTGWTSLTCRSRSPLRQGPTEEVIRWLLDCPPKHRPTDKSEFQAAKVTLAGIQEQISSSAGAWKPST